MISNINFSSNLARTSPINAQTSSDAPEADCTRDVRTSLNNTVSDTFTSVQDTGDTSLQNMLRLQTLAASSNTSASTLSEASASSVITVSSAVSQSEVQNASASSSSVSETSQEVIPLPAQLPPIDLSAMDIIDIASSSASEVGIKSALGAIGGAAAYGIISVVFTAEGTKGLIEGIKEHDKEGIVSSLGSISGGVGAGLETAAETIETLKGATAFTKIAGAAAGPLSVISSSMDVIFGTKSVVEGVKNHSKKDVISGLLKAGYGTAMAAASITGGLPALAAAGALLAGRAAYSIYNKHAAKKQLQEQQQQLTQNQPFNLDRTVTSSSSVSEITQTVQINNTQQSS